MNQEQKDFLCVCIQSDEFQSGQIYEIMRAIENGLTIEQIKIIANKQFSEEQMTETYYAIKELPHEQALVVANPKLDSAKMEELRISFKDYGLTIEQAKYIIGLNCRWSEIKTCTLAFRQGLTKEEVEILMKGGLSWKQAIDLYSMLVNGLTLEQVKRLQEIIQERRNNG